MAYMSLFFGSPKASITVSARLCSLAEVHDSLPSLAVYWQHSVSCDCRTEAPVFFFSVKWVLLSAPREPSKVLATWSSHNTAAYFFKGSRGITLVSDLEALFKGFACLSQDDWDDLFFINSVD